jgi:hypothetical protein
MNAVTAPAPSAAGQLGTIVSWKVPSEIAYSDLQIAMGEAGMDPDLAPEMAPIDALSRALGEMKKNRVIRKLRHENDMAFFQLTKETKTATQFEYEHETDVALDTKTGAIHCADPAIAHQAAKLLAEHNQKRMTGDMTRLLQKFYDSFMADLIPIREQGGAYFVPDVHRDLVDTTRTFLERIGGRLRSFDVRLGSDDTSQSVAESMTEYLKQLIGDFRESCADVDGTSRKDVKARRRGSVVELRHKLELYKGLLGGYAESIEEQIKTADEELLRKLATGLKEDGETGE